MVDDKQPVSGASSQDEPLRSPSDAADAPSHPTPNQSEPPAGWHEPPAGDESSRPEPAESWYTPEGADAVTDTTPDTDQAVEEDVLPGTEPEHPGAWFAPIDAQLDALLAGADDTIIERHEPDEPADLSSQPSDATQPQLAADTQALPETQEASEEPTPIQAPAEAQTPESVGEGEHLARLSDTVSAEEDGAETAFLESEADAGSTPVSEDTPPKVDLSPAERALLEEQDAAQAPTTPEGAETAAQPPERSPGPPPEPEPSPFEQVESKVAVLRQRFEAGYLTREQLQNELRSMMILDDDGHWWMLGLETNRWYYYDGKDWVAANPPGYEQRVQGSAVRTETGMQEVVVTGDQMADEQIPQRPLATDIEIDEDGMPLPRRVPQEDPGATLVSANAPFMEPVRPSDAQTLSRSRQVETGAEGDLTIPAGADIPGRPTQDDASAQTIRSGAITAGQDEAPRPIPVPQQQDAQQPRRPVGAEAAAAEAGQQQPPGQQPPQGEPPKRYRIGEYPQPDYSAAFGAAHDRNTYIRWAVRAVVIGMITGMFLTLVVLLGMIGYYLYEVDRYSDAVASLTERTANFENSQILDANGALLAEFSNPNAGLRTEVPLDQISPWLIHATISTENETFYTDPGFSVLAIVRATVQNLQAGSTVSGASTITQQLARALVLETEFASQRTNKRKIVEIIVASEIKRKYSKNEILEIYLNEIFYGNLAYGIEAAARTYFHKTAAELNPAEAAFLAGLPQSPATYDPVVNREAALQRMREVLRLMSEANGTGCIYIEHNDATSWGVPAGTGLCVEAREQPDGSTAYYYRTTDSPDWTEMTLDIALVETAPFSRPAVEYTHPHFVNYVWQQLEDEYGPQRIYSAGFRVTTTLNEAIQGAAENAVTSGLANLQARGFNAENASVVVIRPEDGAVLAMVGSADYYNEDIDGQVNVAFTGQQPGSSIKPFVYLTALEPDEQGRYLTPASILWDVYSDFNGYVPTNYDQQYHGPKTVRESLGNSLNVPAVKTLQFAGLEAFTEMANRVGLRFPLGDPIERNAGLPTALGAVEVRLFDMVAGYAMLANNGRRVEPYSIVTITDSQGNPVEWERPNPEGLQVVQPEYAYLITSILADNQARAEEFGYGPPMELANDRIAAVKTGTSNDSRDVWTLGYTPQFAVGVWVGNTDNTPIYGLTGYLGAAPIWNQVMETAHAGLNVDQFVQPPNLIQMEVCNDSGVQAFQDCAGRTHQDIFATGAQPPGPEAHIFRTLQVDDFTGKLVNEYCNDNPVTRTFLNLDDPAAVNWLNNTEAGANWLAERDLEAPLQPPPTEYCAPGEPRPTVVVSFPPDNFTAEGVLPLRGSISMPDFNRYEIRIGVSHDPQAFSDVLEMQTTPRTEPDSFLGQIETTNYENGPYTIRLTVIDNFGRDVVRDIPITINNAQPTAVPTTVIPTPTLAPTWTPAAPGPIATATEPAPDVFPTLTEAPTITPTWTLSPTPP